MVTKAMHVTIGKKFLISLIRENGACEILDNWTGTDAEAIAQIESDPRECIPMGGCDNYDERGFCKGHVSGARGAVASITTEGANGNG